MTRFLVKLLLALFNPWAVVRNPLWLDDKAAEILRDLNKACKRNLSAKADKDARTLRQESSSKRKARRGLAWFFAQNKKNVASYAYGQRFFFVS